MLNPLTTQIWFYPSPIDFRKQIDGLVILVVDSLEKHLTSGKLFLFRNRVRTSSKYYTGKKMDFGCTTSGWKKDVLFSRPLLTAYFRSLISSYRGCSRILDYSRILSWSV